MYRTRVFSYGYLYTALILLLLVGKANATLSFANDDNSNAPVYYLPVTLTNNQGSSISSGTEVCIGASATAGWGCGTGAAGSGVGAAGYSVMGFNPAPYTKYINANASNVNFQDGAGNLLDSWIETPWASTNGPILWWVKLNSSISANSSLTIYMTMVAFGSSSMSTNHTGANPLYNATYGQYDNGANVFKAQYTNFAGTSTPSGWTLTQSTPPAFYINNGVYFSTPGAWNGNLQSATGSLCANTGLTTGSSPTIQSVIAEEYNGGLSGEEAAPLIVGTVGTGDCATGGFVYAGINYSHSYVEDLVGNPDGADFIWLGPINTLTPTPNTWVPSNFPLWVSSVYTTNPASTSTTHISVNYGSPDAPAGSTNSSQVLAFSETSETGFVPYIPVGMYWARWRSYPPNGVEPTSTLGQIQAVSTLAPVNNMPSGATIMAGKVIMASPIQNPTAAVVQQLTWGYGLQYPDQGDYQSNVFYPNAGDTIVVSLLITATSNPSVTISSPYNSGYTWHTPGFYSSGTGYGGQTYYAFNVPAGPATFTTSGLTSGTDGSVYEVLDISNSAGVLDQTATAGARNTSATTTQPGEIAIASVFTNTTTTLTPETGFTAFHKVLPSQGGASGVLSLDVDYNANTGATGSKLGGYTGSGGSPNIQMLTFETVQPLAPVQGAVAVLP